MAFLDKTGATILADEVKTYVGNTAVAKETGKGLSTNDYTTTEKNKLAGIATGAEVNQNAFSKVVVGSTTVAADSKTDSLTLAAGSNVTLTPDATNDKITIASTNTWRGIQDNLTSTSTTDSLAANQGKVLKGLIDEVKSLRATLAAYGLTKVTNSSAVTDTTGLALSATEKNATIDGTLANQIAQLNTDFARKLKINFGLEDMPLIRGGNVDDCLIYKRCRVYGATEYYPFGISGDNDFILENHWFSDGVGDSFAYQIAYNIRADQISFRRFLNGWKNWISII